MKLAEPYYLLLLLFVPLLALAAWLAERQRRVAWQKLVAPRLRRRLAAPASGLARWLSLGCGLFGLSLLILCLAQPIAGEKETTSLVRGRNVIIAIDASRSMLVRDTAPDRLTAAKAAAYDLLDRFPEDRIGLLAFAGSASLQAPLTVDHNALRESLDQLDTTNVPSGGSNLAEAINLATKTFRETGQSTHGLIVLSDGELHEGKLDDATFDARQAGVFVVAIGLGTLEGDFVPDPEEKDGRFRDRSGNPVLSRLNPAPLRTLAGDTGGLYLEGVGNNFADKIDTVIARLDAFEDEGRLQVTPVPRFQWFLLPAMFLLIASLLIRFFWAPARPKGIPAATASTIALAAFLLSGPDLQAEEPGWFAKVIDKVMQPTKSARGSTLLEGDQPKEAITLYQDATKSETGERLMKTHYGEAMAHYQLGQYEQAAETFSKSLLSEDRQLQRDSHFQLANTLYHRGLKAQQAQQAPPEGEESPKKGPKASELLQDAIANYDAALALDKKHQPSQDNREFVKEVLAQIKEQEQQQQEQEEQQKQEGEGEEEQEEGGEQQESEQSENQEGENGEEEQGQEGSEEEQGQDGEQQEGDEGEEGEQEGQQEQPGEEGEEQQSQQSPSAEEGEPLSAREDETAEEFARRILEENADFQKEALRKRGRQQNPTKDW